MFKASYKVCYSDGSEHASYIDYDKKIISGTIRGLIDNLKSFYGDLWFFEQISDLEWQIIYDPPWESHVHKHKVMIRSDISWKIGLKNVHC